MRDLRQFFAIAVTALLVMHLLNTIDNIGGVNRPSRAAPDIPWLTPELASVPR
jgi:hypothetical protein